MKQNEEDYESKCLCVLVLDTSGSMKVNDTIENLNSALKRFKQVIEHDTVTRDRLEVSIVTFDSAIRVVQQPSKLPKITMPELVAHGCSLIVPAIEKAQDIIIEREQYYKSQGIPYYRSMIIVITDGDPYPSNQDIEGLSIKIKNDVDKHKYIFTIIGVGDIQESVMSSLSSNQMPALKKIPISQIHFEEFFDFLSQS